jgi:putative ABC transport system substrate-binding protein
MRVIDDQKKLHAMRRARTSDLRDSGIADTVKTKYKVEPGEVARALRQQIIVLKASSSSDIDLAFATLVERRADALMTNADTLFNNRRVQIVSLAARHAIPAIYVTRDWAAAGGLMSYGAYTGDAWRTVGIYAGRILKGERAAELPVVQPTKFEFVINLQTAKLLGLTLPPTLLARADDVIE